MKRKRTIVIMAAAFVTVGVAVGVFAAVNPAVGRRLAGRWDRLDSETLVVSGFIEAEEVAVAPELGGRVACLLVDEGNQVEAGQVLVQLEGTLLEGRLEVAEAAVEVAEAQLAQATAAARPEQVRRAEADLAWAEAARDGAYQAWQDALAIRDNPQDLNVQIVQAKAQLAAAEAALGQAVALKDAAEIADENYQDARSALSRVEKKLSRLPKQVRPSLPSLPLESHLVPNRYWKAWVGVNSAGAAYDGAAVALRDLYTMRDDSQELDAQVDAAKAQHEAAKAAVQIAQARLDALHAGATEEEIAVIQAQVAQARAARDSLSVLVDKLTVTAPVGGLVLERTIHEGELAAPGSTVLTLADLDDVTLTVYVPEDRLGMVFVGQHVNLRVDTFPDRVFAGTVIAIAHEAEFTPRNVQTQEQRVNMVFAVDVRIPNSDHALKPGLPADAVIVAQEQ